VDDFTFAPSETTFFCNGFADYHRASCDDKWLWSFNLILDWFNMLFHHFSTMHFFKSFMPFRLIGQNASIMVFTSMHACKAARSLLSHIAKLWLKASLEVSHFFWIIGSKEKCRVLVTQPTFLVICPFGGQLHGDFVKSHLRSCIGQPSPHPCHSFLAAQFSAGYQ